MKVYKCNDCGALVAVSWSSDEPAICRGENLSELEPERSEAAGEKHIPVVSVDGRRVRVSVGSVTHPQTSEHGITWVAIKTTNGEQIRYLPPLGAPAAEFLITDGERVELAYAFCNLHGLWVKEM